MEHHEANHSYTSRRQDDEGAYYGSSSTPALIRPCSPPMEESTANFRSQRISSPSTSISMGMGIPLLQQPSLSKSPATDSKSSMDFAQDDSLSSGKSSVGTIPVFPSFHIMDRTAIQTSEDILTLVDRILNYMKTNSIRYECEPDTGCFDCTSPNMVEFAVQLWRNRVDSHSASQPNSKKIWIEVQRRQGCALAMNSIRRSLLRHITGEPAVGTAPAAGTRRPCSDTTTSSFSLDSNIGSNKRQRSMTAQEARLSCQDAFVVAVRLLKSHRRDQQRLGLESMVVMTDAKAVGSIGATTVSRALILGEGPAGLRLQQRLVALLQEIRPALVASGFGQYSYQGSILAAYYHLFLLSLANALGQVSCGSMTPRMDLTSPFWQTVTSCLRASLEDAMSKPQEAALSAKCLRFLLPSKTQETLHPPTLRSILSRTVEAGRSINLSLEEESRKTLAFL